jgi:2-oxoglutarate dehydrogenase E1 component
MSDFSFISNAHPAYIESMYVRYSENPASVATEWYHFFKGFEFAESSKIETKGVGQSLSTKEFQVIALINAYRSRGHLLSTTNPIRQRRDRNPKLHIEDFNLTESDLSSSFSAAAECGLPAHTSLNGIIAHLNRIYCGNIGFEYQHIQDRDKRRWLREKIEKHQPENQYGLSIEKKKRILEKLNGAVIFEKFLHTKYIGQKRFSLEGGEATIAAIDAIINYAAAQGAKEVIMGMAHRGRLNVLANILGKTYTHIFNEFEGIAIPDQSFGDGDVKYHLGYSSQVKTPEGITIHLELAPNPSHLESVNPVVEGFSRAKANVLYQENYDAILPLLIHGDAAVAGQGVVYETVQMSKLPGYYTGGTLHFVINNQVGFTTDWEEARSSTYCTAAANAIGAPVFHVNGDDPEAIVFVAELATEYRQTFHEDVFIDMVCYRRHGHNEGDDPKFTQPDMYSIIHRHPNPREIYLKRLIERGELEKKMADELEIDFWNMLQERLNEVKEQNLPYIMQEPEQAWKVMIRSTYDHFENTPITGVDKSILQDLLDKMHAIPSTFHPLPKMKRLIEDKIKMVETDKLDWSIGELLAYATILNEGKDVRMSGQDVKRGTFSHRHAVLFDADTNAQYNRLSKLSADQGVFRIFNSLLSEFAVLGFEYGFSLATPHALNIWEAQFGDFYNGAQTIIDQYIMSAESKWNRQSGLVLLLPHGYEGQGPEHSSARLERFLQNCAEMNWIIANVTQPANFFHLLRRQLAFPFRKPLVVMSPKSMLRHPECVSSLMEFTGDSKFREIIDDPEITAKGGKKIFRILFCSGKIYYDLNARKKEEKRDDIAIIRLEQLYPLPEKQIRGLLENKYTGAMEIYWVQEEPANMGAWRHVSISLTDIPFRLISRRRAASPATGFKKRHDEEQEIIVSAAFEKKKG